MLRLLIGGSPCTYWSVAQKKGREVEAEGFGWELFKNYLLAKEKFKPDFFLYENNKSAAPPIKAQISRELGVDLMHINSALVSAQNRERFYAFNWEVQQPADRGILLKDVLEANATEKHYALSAPPVSVGCRNRRESEGRLYLRFETSGSQKANALTTVQTDSMVAEPVRIGTIENSARNQAYDSKQYRVYSPDGKSTTLCGQGGGLGAKTGLYAIPATETAKSPLYKVADGQVEIKGRLYPVKLPDGYYIIRKLTPVECERLQTLPDGYTSAVSATQRYKGLGNGWTAEVIIHILTGALQKIPRDTPLTVLSMYDGIGTGRYCLNKMGFANIKYFSYEIDKPAMKVANSNWSDIIQMGDAFSLRDDSWSLP